MDLVGVKKGISGLFNRKAQITLAIVWKILAIVGLVVAVIIIFFIRGNVSNYLAKFYDCIRFRGCL